ncbi:hypothetical protein ABZZ20_30635 [Streptomyces sp. NPDC006430]
MNNAPKLRADRLAKEPMTTTPGALQNRSSEMQALIDKLENWP